MTFGVSQTLKVFSSQEPQTFQIALHPLQIVGDFLFVP
jgi:hypothetical protein